MDLAAPTDDRAKLEAIVRRCLGNRSAIARELGTSRQVVTRRLEQHHLLALVEQLAVQHGVSGRRKRGSGDEATQAEREDRARILDGLAQADSYDAAAAALKIPSRTLYRRIARYGITQAQVEQRRAELHASA